MKDLLDDIQKKLMELTPEEDARYTIVKKGKKGPQVKRHFTDQKKALDAVMEDAPEDTKINGKDIIHVDSQDHDLSDMPDVLSSPENLANESPEKPAKAPVDAEEAAIMELVGDIDDEQFGDSEELEEEKQEYEMLALEEDKPENEGALSSMDDVHLDDRGFDIPDQPITAIKPLSKKKDGQNEIDVLELEEAMNQVAGTSTAATPEPGIRRTGQSPKADLPHEEEEDNSFDLEEPTPIDPEKLPGVNPKPKKSKPLAPPTPAVESSKETNFAETMIFTPKISRGPSETQKTSQVRPAESRPSEETKKTPPTEKPKQEKSKAAGGGVSKWIYIAAGCGGILILAALAWLFVPSRTVDSKKPDTVITRAAKPADTQRRPVQTKKAPAATAPGQTPSPVLPVPPPETPQAADPLITPVPEAEKIETAPPAVAEPVTPPAISEERKRVEEVKNMIEGWRVAWENSATASGDVRTYETFFSESFKSGGLDKAAFIQDKLVKNRRKQYIRIKLENLEIYQPEEKDQAIVTFFQHYDSSNYSDKGQVNLILRKESEQWKIVETPSVMPPGKRIEPPSAPSKTEAPAPPVQNTTPAPVTAAVVEKADSSPPVTNARKPEPVPEGLPETKDKTPAPITTATGFMVPAENGSMPFTIHAGSYQEYRRAFAIASDLIRKGFPAFLTKVDVPDKGDSFRLCIGSFAGQWEAQPTVIAIRNTPDIDEPSVLFREYAIQIGRFSSEENAARAFHDLLEKGLTTYALRDRQSPGTIRLMVGAFENREDAAKIAEELRNEGFMTVIEQR